MAGTVATTDETVDAFSRSHRAVAALVARSIERGEVRADLSAIDVFMLIQRFGRRPAPAPDADPILDPWLRVLAVALDGLAPETASPLPGTTPTLGAYGERWWSARPPAADSETH